MSKTYLGFFRAKIISYNPNARTVKVSIPTVTDGIDDGITATLAYAIGQDDRDTEIEILPGADCYIFFEQGDPSSPVVWSYSSHGINTTIDHRRIRQENIELLARANINLNAEETIHLKSSRIVLEANQVIIIGNSITQGDSTVQGMSDLVGLTTIEGKPFLLHGHKNVRSGTDDSGPVS